MTNKIALITGGSRGLGKEAALRLAKKGHDVIITYNQKQDEAQKVVHQIESLGRKSACLQLDVAQSGSFDAFFQTVGKTLQEKWATDRFHALVNNAGIGGESHFHETTEELFDQMCNIHLKSVFFLSQKALPLLSDGGRIVNVSSGLARFSLPGYSAYGTMKGAVETLTRYMAKELGGRKITVNVVAPGAVATDFNKDRFENKGVTDFIASLTALGRVGEAEDIGGVVAFLCSDDAGWINGQRIEISGGMFL